MMLLVKVLVSVRPNVREVVRKHTKRRLKKINKREKTERKKVLMFSVKDPTTNIYLLKFNNRESCEICNNKNKV